MITKKLTIIILLVTLIILITGCSGQNTEMTIEDPYIGGSQGIIATFEPMAPIQNGVQTIYDDESFTVDINLKNKGEFTIPTSAVSSILKGISAADFTGLSFTSTNPQQLEKISDFNAAGGEGNINHGSAKLVANRIKDRNALPVNVFAEIVYPYKTFISAPKVCFKDPSSTSTRDQVCEVDSTLQVFSSGSPIKASSAVESRSGKGLVSVKFVIENVGGGNSKSPDNAQFDYRYDEIKFTVQESSDPNKWDCTSAGRVGVGRFREDKSLEIICKLKESYKISADQVYQSQLDLTLEYNYKILINSDLLIRNNE